MSKNKQYYEPFGSIFISFYYFKHFYATFDNFLQQNIPRIEEINTNSALEVVMEYFKHRTFDISVKGAFYSSLAVALHSLIEECFNKISEHVSNKLQTTFTISDFNNPLSNQLKHYFDATKLYGLKDHDISIISAFSKIRNCIVHDNGIVNGNCQIKNVLKQFKGLEIDEFEFKLLVSSEFCSSQIDFFENLLIRIADSNNFSYELPIQNI